MFLVTLFPIDWKYKSSDKKGRTILDCVESNNLTQLVDFPTHTGGNLLDVTITDKPALVHNIYNGGNIGNSDHAIICIELFLNQVKTNYTGNYKL